MTDKQKAFADLYVQCGSAAEAARRAGYSDRSARTTGARLLAKADVKQYIASRLGALEGKRIADCSEVLALLTSIMRGETKDQFGLDSALADRIKAAALLLKRFNSADQQQDTMTRLDGLLCEFRLALQAATTDDTPTAAGKEL